MRRRRMPDYRAPDVDAIDTRLRAERYSALAIVHHETTTGLLNDLAPIAALCRRRNVRLLVDAVSALGGEPFDFARWQPDAVACTANKCVAGSPRIVVCSGQREFIEAMSDFSGAHALPAPAASFRRAGAALDAVHAGRPSRLRAARGARGTSRPKPCARASPATVVPRRSSVAVSQISASTCSCPKGCGRRP